MPTTLMPTRTAVPGSLCRHQGALIQGTVVTQFWSPQEIGWTVQGDSRLDAQEGLSPWEPAWWLVGTLGAPGGSREVSEGRGEPKVVHIPMVIDS